LCVAAAGVVAVRMRVIDSAPFRDPLILAALGVMVSYAPMAALEAVSAELARASLEKQLGFYFVRSMCIVFGMGLFLASFWISMPPRREAANSSNTRTAP